MNKVKLQLILSGALFALSILILAGATIAYFSDFYQASSTITSGNVSIELSQSAVKHENGDLVKDPDAPRLKGGSESTIRDYGLVYAGMSVCKDPTITNVGENEAWVAAKVTIADGMGDLQKIMGYGEEPGIDMTVLLADGILGESARFGTWNGIPNVRYNNNYAIVQSPDPENDQFYFYIFFLNTLKPGEEVVLWEYMNIPSEWTTNQMRELIELSITIQAFGVQTSNLESCYEAMLSAFPKHFSE